MFKTKSYLYIKITAFLICLTVLANNSFISFSLGNFYYAILIISLLILIISSKKPIINWAMSIFFIACVFSILVNDIPYFYKPHERLIAFVLLISLIGPFIQTPNLYVFKAKLFAYLNASIVFLVILSFIGLIINSPLVYMGRGGFSGFFNHSMFLSPMAGISMLTCVYYFKKSSKQNRKIFFLLMTCACFIVCVTAGSRVALIAALIGLLYFFYQLNKNNLTSFLKIILLISLVGTVSFPLWQPYTSKLIEKMEYAEEQGSLTSTREILWKRRIAEFTSAPLFGIGYSNDSSMTENDSLIGEGQVEPGSSWLVVLSMTGIFGAFGFILVLFKSIGILKAKEQTVFIFYLNSLFVFFVIHLFAEGYVLSAGSGLFFYFWLLLGVLFQTIKYKTLNIK